MKVDYWVCDTCGTHYGHEDESCDDPYCQEKRDEELARDLQDQYKEDLAQDQRLESEIFDGEF